MDDHLIAHVRRNSDDSWAEPQTLSAHILGTSEYAERFASEFNSAEWGKACGLAHDAGKSRPAWQAYLRSKSGYYEYAHIEATSMKILHAIYGANLVEELYGKEIGRVLSYCIAGHHAGIPDWSSSETGLASLKSQKNQANNFSDIDSEILDLLKANKPTRLPRRFAQGMDFSFWIRMLFSSLVDADFLDTERYMNDERYHLRGGYLRIDTLLEKLNSHMDLFENNSAKTKVNRIRKEIRVKCQEAAQSKQGIFSLTVPTGGGKTLSSLTFALEHAKKYGLNRIIYVIPYTSIIEQNANVFKSVLGDDQVIEHHSSLDEEKETPKSRISAENWDAPVIVTTSVQFFESLFSAKPGRCRKLHNIANSVVILDEAQLVPAEFLKPILSIIQLLVDHYNVSFVISTATQPAFADRVESNYEFNGLKEIKEIVGTADEVKKLYDSLKRNTIKFPMDLNTPISWGELAEDLLTHDRVLCIVSDRKSCRELYKLMPQGSYHLSALMCGSHRSQVIAEIKQKLINNEVVRVISTQLVEAGVDVDFPIVYRALAGLDSIVQAAGRCNREGKMESEGIVNVFIPPRSAPPGYLRKALETTLSILKSNQLNDIDQQTFEQYFSELYWKVNDLDKAEIVDLLDPSKNDRSELSIYFRTASERFRIIDDRSQRSIFVRYGDGNELIYRIKDTGPDRMILRKLQRYTVNVSINEFNKLSQSGAVEEIHPGIFALSSDLFYSKEFGLLIDDSEIDTSRFIN